MSHGNMNSSTENSMHTGAASRANFIAERSDPKPVCIAGSKLRGRTPEYWARHSHHFARCHQNQRINTCSSSHVHHATNTSTKLTNISPWADANSHSRSANTKPRHPFRALNPILQTSFYSHLVAHPTTGNRARKPVTQAEQALISQREVNSHEV